jgi:thymidylate synthase
VLPGRNNNVFAQLAETAWVLAGRNDLAFLGHYLPRVADFSDDGRTWRGAYGPRIRRWGGD